MFNMNIVLLIKILEYSIVQYWVQQYNIMIHLKPILIKLPYLIFFIVSLLCLMPLIFWHYVHREYDFLVVIGLFTYVDSNIMTSIALISAILWLLYLLLISISVIFQNVYETYWWTYGKTVKSHFQRLC